MTMEPQDSLTPRRINELRGMSGPVIALTLYLDLPDDLADHLLSKPDRDDVLALDQDLSLALLALIQEHPGIAHGIDDEAARAIHLFLALGQDRQAVLASLVESALNSRPCPSEPDVFARENIEATWRRNVPRYGLDEAERIRHEAEANACRQKPIAAPERALEAADVLEAVNNLVRFPRAE